jgi:hypothetical protein
MNANAKSINATSRTARTSPVQHALPISDGDLRRAILTQIGSSATSLVVRVFEGNVYVQAETSSSFDAQYLTRVIEQIAGVQTVTCTVATRSSATRASAPRQSLRLQSPNVSWNGVVIALSAATIVIASWVFWPGRGAGHLPLVAADVTVRLENEPLAGARLTLHPLQLLRDSNGKDVSGLRPSGFVQQDGHVTWTTLQPGDGIPAGQYAVTAIWHRPFEKDGETAPGPNLLPNHFSDPTQTPLRLFVQSDEQRQDIQVNPHQRFQHLDL